jgi:4-pyridoxolactonase
MAKATKVRLLDSGSLVIDQSHITWNVGCGNPVRFPVYSVLIEHPEGLFLFDTGYDLDLVNAVLPFELPQQTPEQTIPAQLRLCGFEPADVDAVVNSHLHFDHCGGNKHLTKATTFLHAQEIREARSPEPFERLGYADRSWDHADASFTLIDGDAELADGLHVFHTPGHTIGHLSLLVELDGGGPPLLFMADVTYTPAAYANDQQAGFHHDPVAGVRSIRRIRQIARETGAQLFFTHDMDEYDGYRHAPEAYGGESA